MTKAIQKIQQTRKASVREARDNFSNLLGMVYYGYQTITIEKSGEPCAILVNPLAWQQYQGYLKDKAFRVVKELRKVNKHFSEGKIARDIEEARTEVCQVPGNLNIKVRINKGAAGRP